MTVQWLPESQTLLVGGNKLLALATMDESNESEWELIFEENIPMEEDISYINCFSDDILLCFSSKNKEGVIWRMNEEGGAKIGSFTSPNPLVSFAYHKDTQTLALMDNEGKIGLHYQNYSGKEDHQEAEDDSVSEI